MNAARQSRSSRHPGVSAKPAGCAAKTDSEMEQGRRLRRVAEASTHCGFLPRHTRKPGLRHHFCAVPSRTFPRRANCGAEAALTSFAVPARRLGRPCYAWSTLTPARPRSRMNDTFEFSQDFEPFLEDLPRKDWQTTSLDCAMADYWVASDGLVARRQLLSRLESTDSSNSPESRSDSFDGESRLNFFSSLRSYCRSFGSDACIHN